MMAVRSRANGAVGPWREKRKTGRSLGRAWAAVLVLLVLGSSAAAVSLSLAPTRSAPPLPQGTGSFGDTLASDFQQGWRNGTDTYGRNDHVVHRDDFDGSHIDPNTWLSIGDARGAPSHRNGSARHEITAPGTTENNSLSFFRGSFSGDFDVGIEMRLTHWTNSDGMASFFGVCPQSVGCTGALYAVGRANFSGTESYLGLDAYVPETTIPTGDTIASLRITRTGALLVGSFLNATSGMWEPLFTNSTGPLEPMQLVFGIHENDTTPILTGPVSAEFDEFDEFSAGGSIADAPFSTPTGIPIQDAVRLLPYSDNFDDGFRNPDRWANPVITDGSTSETAGRLNQSCSNSGGVENVLQAMREPLTGDFDARVEFNLATVPLTGGWRASLGVSIGGLDFHVSRARGAGDQRYQVITDFTLGNTALTSNISGDLRLARVGSTLSFYFGEVGEWNALQSSAVAASPATVYLAIRCTGAPYPPLSAEFDSFQVVADRGESPATYADAMFESRILDTGETAPSQPKWGDLWFNSSTPAGTSVRFQLASSDSPGGPWTFTGPDGTGATWYTASGSPAILLDGDRYFRYRAELNSTNASATPVLWDVAVTAEGPNIPEFGAGGVAALSAVVAGLVVAGGSRLRRRRGESLKS